MIVQCKPCHPILRAEQERHKYRTDPQVGQRRGLQDGDEEEDVTESHD